MNNLLSNSLEQRNIEYEIVSRQIQKQNEKLQQQLQEIDNRFDILKKQDEIQKKMYQKRSQNATIQFQQKLDKANEYNKNFYSLEFKKYISITNQIKNKIRNNNMYLSRIQYFIDYLSAKVKKDPIKEINSYYNLLNVIQTEALNKVKTEYEYYNDKIDINNDYLVCISLCENNAQGTIESLSSYLMTSEQNLEAKEKTRQTEFQLENYKNVFKTRKLELENDLLTSNILMKYDIDEVISQIYPKPSKIL